MGMRRWMPAAAMVSLPFFFGVFITILCWRRHVRKKRERRIMFMQSNKSALGGDNSTVTPAARLDSKLVETKPLPESAERALPDTQIEVLQEKTSFAPPQKYPSMIGEEMSNYVSDESTRPKEDSVRSREEAAEIRTDARPKIIEKKPPTQQTRAVPKVGMQKAVPNVPQAPSLAAAPEPRKSKRTSEELELPRNLDSAMMSAIARGDSAAVEDTLMMGDVGVNDVLDLKTGNTALHTAAAYGQHDIARFLIEVVGADTLVRDNKGRNAAAIAQMHGHYDLAEEITSYVPPYMPGNGLSNDVVSASDINLTQGNGNSHKHTAGTAMPAAPYSTFRDIEDISHPHGRDVHVQDSSFLWMKDEGSNVQSIVVPSQNKFEYSVNHGISQPSPGRTRQFPPDRPGGVPDKSRSDFVYLRDDDTGGARSEIEPPPRSFPVPTHPGALPRIPKEEIRFDRRLYPGESSGDKSLLERSSLGRGLYAA